MRTSPPERSSGWSKAWRRRPSRACLASWVTNFAAFDAAHGWAVNLFAVIALAAIGVAFLIGRPRIVFWAVIAGTVFCLADWVLIEDFGFFGGVGTDPNSMIPMALIFVAGYLAITRLPATAEEPLPRIGPSESAVGWWGRFTSRPAYALRSLAAIGAIGDHRARCRPDGSRRDESRRRPDPHRGDRRSPGLTNIAGRAVPTRRPGREDGQPQRTCGERPSRSRSSIRSAPRTARSSPRSSARPTRCSARRRRQDRVRRHRGQPRLSLDRRHSCL